MSYFHLGSDSEQLMHEQDKQEAYDQLRKRASDMGFACVNEALDELERLSARYTSVVISEHGGGGGGATFSSVSDVKPIVRVKKSDA